MFLVLQFYYFCCQFWMRLCLVFFFVAGVACGDPPVSPSGNRLKRFASSEGPEPISPSKQSRVSAIVSPPRDGSWPPRGAMPARRRSDPRARVQALVFDQPTTTATPQRPVVPVVAAAPLGLGAARLMDPKQAMDELVEYGFINSVDIDKPDELELRDMGRLSPSATGERHSPAWFEPPKIGKKKNVAKL